METTDLININHLTMSVGQPVALSNLKSPLTATTTLKSPVTISSARTVLASNKANNKSVTITPRFTANLNLANKADRALNIITVHNNIDKTSALFTA